MVSECIIVPGEVAGDLVKSCGVVGSRSGLSQVLQVSGKASDSVGVAKVSQQLFGKELVVVEKWSIGVEKMRFEPGECSIAEIGGSKRDFGGVVGEDGGIAIDVKA